MLGSSDKEKFDSMYLKDDKLKTPVKETEKAVSDDEDESQAGGDHQSVGPSEDMHDAFKIVL